MRCSQIGCILRHSQPDPSSRNLYRTQNAAGRACIGFVLSAQTHYSALSTQDSQHQTQHPALRTQHSALSTQDSARCSSEDSASPRRARRLHRLDSLYLSLAGLLRKRTSAVISVNREDCALFTRRKSARGPECRRATPGRRNNEVVLVVDTPNSLCG
jgi:hypothetical protein